MEMLRNIWAYRGFIAGSVKREFQSKYRNSLLGMAWAVVNPMAMIIVYTVIFSQIMRAKLPGLDHGLAYGIYLCAGVIAWGLFSEITGRGLNVFLENSTILKKISFPRMTLPIIVVLNAGVNFCIIFGLFLIFLALVGLWPGWASVAVIPVLVIQLILAVGLAMTLGVLNVFFRDVGQFFGLFLQFWFWFTPVVYPVSILPDLVKPLMALNPMFPLIQAYQGIFVSHLWPLWPSLVYPLALGLVLCGVSLRLFRRHIGEIVDEL